MFKTINGWTKARMIAQINARNNGTKSRCGTQCMYRDSLEPHGNACAIGCFITDDDYDPVYEQQGLMAISFEFRLCMPLALEGLIQLQSVHDRAAFDHDPRPGLVDWINQNVEDA